MFRKYGILGLLMIIFVEINFLLRIEPFARWYFPIVWFGYIFLIDAVNFKLSRRSLISSRPRLFLGLLVLSAFAWWIFELLGGVLSNWSYQGLVGFGSWAELLAFGTISFSTMIPAVFETFLLVRAFHLFDRVRLRKKHDITGNFLHLMTALGLVCLVLLLLWPAYFYPLTWVAFFFLLDPINYLHKQPSIIGHLKDRRLVIPVSLFAAGIICGFLWEFWNFWAIPKWTYSIPFVGFLKIFEMPVLGYLGYGPFAWELYAMYHFARSLVAHKKEGFIRI